MDRKVIAGLMKELNLYWDFINWFFNKYFIWKKLNDIKDAGLFKFMDESKGYINMDDWEWANKNYSKDEALLLFWKISSLHLFFTKRRNYLKEYGFWEEDKARINDYIKIVLNEIEKELIIINGKCDGIFDKWKISLSKRIDYEWKKIDGELIENIEYYDLSKDIKK